ncbi:alpha-1A adrenergic receptor-like [Hydractinia symbiolongicarpus]|uniref:alpha-1A adrenergic receptor-like n=1 Tax=Hydractinia symbiolongicarpus TaxID=13093 RepID=UPI00254A012C|nr:alpha-1A adrenergic receptor-like [Hydractinia symbiolongicarpus]XP_057301972.1 alpha-1A adrenergic receptor-like [Hydractinia symbiolongicarpus]XP_057301973.1 alpha-1A adrenergic receptor-like [Hydractinia symbiolongicarpus]
MEDALIYLIVILIATICSVFNIITIVIVLIDRKLRNSITNRPILSFLFASTIQGLLPSPFYVYKKLEQEDHIPNWICDGYRLPYFFCGHVMKISLVLISIDRLLAVRYPFKYEKFISKFKMTATLLLLWVVTLVIDILPFFIGDRNDGFCEYIPTRSWGLSVIIVYNLISFCIILINYILIWIVAAKFAFKDKSLKIRIENKENRDSRLSQKSGSKVGEEDNNRENEKSYVSKRLKFAFEMKATKTSLALIAVYVFCWGPLGVFYMIDHFCYNCLSDDDDLKLTRAFVKLLSFSSSILAPIVYCWWNRDFRKSARTLWNRHCIGKCVFKEKDEKNVTDSYGISQRN